MHNMTHMLLLCRAHCGTRWAIDTSKAAAAAMAKLNTNFRLLDNRCHAIQFMPKPSTPQAALKRDHRQLAASTQGAVAAATNVCSRYCNISSCAACVEPQSFNP
jgi:hypothetical protein